MSTDKVIGSCQLITLIYNSMEVASGYGRHTEYLTPEQQIATTRGSIIATALIVMGSLCSKRSISLVILRLLGNAVTKKRKAFFYVFMLVISIGNVVDVMKIFIQCNSTSRIRNREVNGTYWKPRVLQNFGYMLGGK